MREADRRPTAVSHLGISVKITIIYEYFIHDLTIRVLILPESQELV